MPNQYIEERVQQQNHIILHRHDIQKHRLCLWNLKGVLQECRLNHQQGVFDIFPHQQDPIIGTFVR